MRCALVCLWSFLLASAPYEASQAVTTTQLGSEPRLAHCESDQLRRSIKRLAAVRTMVNAQRSMEGERIYWWSRYVPELNFTARMTSGQAEKHGVAGRSMDQWKHEKDRFIGVQLRWRPSWEPFQNNRFRDKSRWRSVHEETDHWPSLSHDDLDESLSSIQAFWTAECTALAERIDRPSREALSLSSFLERYGFAAKGVVSP